MTTIPKRTHIDRPWRIHELTGGFDLEDVWALPTPGGPDDFPRLVALLANPGRAGGDRARAARMLWATRIWIGALLGWDGEDQGIGARVPSLRGRMPADLRAAPTGPPLARPEFRPLYLLDDEYAAEIANRTVHGVLHVGWAPDADGGGFHGEMAVYVKPEGLLGHAYLAAIRPFRRLVVYPAMLRHVGERWRATQRDRPAAAYAGVRSSARSS